MPDRIGVFILAALVLVAIPGPDVLYITARGIDQGRLAGLISAWSAAFGGLFLLWPLRSGCQPSSSHPCWHSAP